jgi:hypothetical protein
MLYDLASVEVFQLTVACLSPALAERPVGADGAIVDVPVLVLPPQAARVNKIVATQDIAKNFLSPNIQIPPVIQSSDIEQLSTLPCEGLMLVISSVIYTLHYSPRIASHNSKQFKKRKHQLYYGGKRKPVAEKRTSNLCSVGRATPCREASLQGRHRCEG